MRAPRITLAAALALAACGANETPLPGVDAGSDALACLPDLDGELRADEVPMLAGLSADYYVSSNVDVDLAGAVDDRGVRVWDMSDPAGAERRGFAVTRASERWYASSFPADALTAPVDSAGAIETIYTVDDDGVWGWGVASAVSNPPGGVTLLPYDEPVALIRFPLRNGDAWTSVGTITGGELDGLPYNGTDTYDVAVDGAGQLELPVLRFTQAHRVLTRVEVAPDVGGATVSRRQVSFWFECFGEVARATSNLDEPSALFTRATELRRFAL